MWYSKSKRDFLYNAPVGFDTRSDARLVHCTFSNEFLQELEQRGYDLATLKFEICPQRGNEKFRSERNADVSGRTD